MDQHGREIASLRSAVVAVNARVDALEERVTRVEDQVELLKKRVDAIERFLSKELGANEKNALLKQVAPILLHDNWESGPLMRPSDFAKDATFIFNGGVERIRAEVAARGGKGFQGDELARWLQAETRTPPTTSWGDLTAEAEMVPQEVRRRGLGAPDRGIANALVKELNKNAIASRVAVFGAVSPLARVLNSGRSSTFGFTLGTKPPSQMEREITKAIGAVWI